MKLTKTQKELFNKAIIYTSLNNPIKYDNLKGLCECKSFDNTFNSLINKGLFESVDSNDYSNKFKLTIKGENLKK